jgi:DtxR family Mn-dependent transcriptional regulator
VDTSSPNVQEYLEAIYSLTEGGEPARTSELAKLLGVKPASATGMIQKLAGAGLVEYRKYRGTTLTPEGMKLGRKMKRKHRILERFLTDVLGIRRDRVHDQACAMEHSLSDEAEEAMCRVMGHPKVCSDDGRPIPPCDRVLDGDAECAAGREAVCEDEGREDLRPLAELTEGGKAVIAFIRGGPNVVKRLNDMGLCPETQVEVTKIAPMKGPVELKVRGSNLVVGRGIASKIFVTTC